MRDLDRLLLVRASEQADAVRREDFDEPKTRWGALSELSPEEKRLRVNAQKAASKARARALARKATES